MSGLHALVRWAGGRWELRDLGSRNGTYVDGEAVDQAVLRAGAVLGFGSVEDPWDVVSVTAPGPVAIDEAGELIAADGGFLIVECADQAAAIWSEGGRWILEDHLGERHDAPDEVLVGGHRFELDLPQVQLGTVEAEPLRCASVAFHFLVPANQEGIQLEILQRRRVLVSSTVAAVELLYRLAALRDEQRALAPQERGWILTDDLVALLGYRNRKHLAVAIHRARRVAGQAGLTDASDIVQRDPTTDSVRFGGVETIFERA